MPKAKDKDVLQELVPFLGDKKAEVRAIALQNLIVYTDNEPGKLMLQGTDIESYLIKLLREELRDDDSVRRLQTRTSVYTALVNLSGDETFCQRFLKLNILDKVMETIGNEDPKISSLQSMLLINLTVTQEGSSALLGIDSPCPGVHIPRLIELFNRPAHDDDPFSHLAHVFVNITRIQEGRVLLLDPTQSLLSLFVPHFTSPNPARRQVLAACRNSLFETDFGHLIKTDFMEKLMLTVVGDKPFAEKDKEGMPISWISANERGQKREEDRDLRKVVVDILFLMAASLEGRMTMRRMKVYPILRDWHLDESDEEIMEMITLVVQYILLNDNVEEEMTAAAVDEMSATD
eukprot:TRINITY_DN1511_c0_g1_i1.p1 TRINITY_DN1511_c0_g1~~TRINITY_DN1511_c0_g1_i1.p1  ORF type:complete len:348 (+),score=94.60 TRINITY_DN1511_c0_g1_i1:88-1131(+)